MNNALEGRRAATPTAEQQHQQVKQCSSLVVLEEAVDRVLLCEHGKLMFSRNTNLAAFDTHFRKAGQLLERRDAAAHLGVGKVESLKLSEVLKEGQAAAHIGVGEVESLKLSEGLKEGQAAAHLGVGEVEAVMLSEDLKEG